MGLGEIPLAIRRAAAMTASSTVVGESSLETTDTIPASQA